MRTTEPRRGIALELGRRSFVALAATMLFVRRAWAELPVPPRLQAQLISKLACFDRNFEARAGAKALVLIVQRPGNAESSRVAGAMVAAVGALSDVGGVPATVDLASYTSADELAAVVKARRVAVVYLSLGLEGALASVANALSGVDVLTVGATGQFAEAGANIGFDLEASHAKFVVNLRTAKAQNVSLRSELLTLARLVRS